MEAGTPVAANGAGIVQQLLAEKRELMVANERLRLELADVRGQGEVVDPRLSVLEQANRSLRDELARAKLDLERFERDLERLLSEVEKAKAPPPGARPLARRSEPKSSPKRRSRAARRKG
jgi:hypothetical protein